MEQVEARDGSGPESVALNPFQRLWRRGRERFIDSALTGAGVAAGLAIVGTDVHFFVSRAIGVTPEALRQTYEAFLPTAALTMVAVGVTVGVIAEMLRSRKQTEPNKNRFGLTPWD